MKQIIYQFCREYGGRFLIKSLERRSKENGDDFKFVDLVDILSEDALPNGRGKELAFSHVIGDYVGTEMIGNPYAVIWSPHPSEKDWFAKLADDNYEGKKILVHSGNFGVIKMDEEFGTHADYEIEHQPNLADKVYEALRE